MEKMKIEVPPNSGTNEEFIAAATAAGWSDDPGTGKAILIKDERGAPGYEIPNPTPFAPPIGWTPTPPLEELVRNSVQRELALRDDDVIDDIIDAEDFDVPDELPPLETIYEFIAMEPTVPKVKPVSDEERAKAQVEYEAVLANHRAIHREKAVAAHNKIKDEARRLYGEPPDEPDEKPIS